MAVGGGRGATAADRLDRFYAPQAGSYDRFRARLLKGREQLLDLLPFAGSRTWVDVGGGTGYLLQQAGPRLARLESAVLLDLSASLLEVARARVAQRGWTNVHVVHGDATSARLPVETADLVTFSYSLTMIPEWMAVLDRAYRLLSPWGVIGVVDFYVGPKHPPAGRVGHGWLTRTGWPAWFARDDVFLTPDHLQFLQWRFETLHLEEQRARLPFLPLVRAPYYLFVGRRR